MQQAQAVFVPLVEAISRLLAQQAQAIHDGRADDLPALAHLLAQHMALMRSVRAGSATPAWRIALQELQQRAAANLDMLNRRQRDVQRSLDALGAGSALLQHNQNNRVYAAAGMLSAGPLRGQSYATA